NPPPARTNQVTQGHHRHRPRPARLRRSHHTHPHHRPPPPRSRVGPHQHRGPRIPPHRATHPLGQGTSRLRAVGRRRQTPGGHRSQTHHQGRPRRPTTGQGLRRRTRNQVRAAPGHLLHQRLPHLPLGRPLRLPAPRGPRLLHQRRTAHTHHAQSRPSGPGRCGHQPHHRRPPLPGTRHPPDHRNLR